MMVQVHLTCLSQCFSMRRNEGITDVVNTVHFQHPKMEEKEVSLKFIKGQIDRLNEY